MKMEDEKIKMIDKKYLKEMENIEETPKDRAAINNEMAKEKKV